MKILLLSIATLLLCACSSSYTPSEKMLAYKKNMNTEQAIDILQQEIWGTKDSQGICGSRGFWYDSNAKMQVHKDHISMLSHKRGKVLRTHQKKIGEVVVFEKQYYEYEFAFDKITGINIYDDLRILPVFPDCKLKDFDEKYLVIDLFADDLNNLKFIVLEKDFDQAIRLYEAYLEGLPEQSPYRSLTKLALATCHEEKGDAQGC